MDNFFTKRRFLQATFIVSALFLVACSTSGVDEQDYYDYRQSDLETRFWDDETISSKSDCSDFDNKANLPLYSTKESSISASTPTQSRLVASKSVKAETKKGNKTQESLYRKREVVKKAHPITQPKKIAVKEEPVQISTVKKVENKVVVSPKKTEHIPVVNEVKTKATISVKKETVVAPVVQNLVNEKDVSVPKETIIAPVVQNLKEEERGQNQKQVEKIEEVNKITRIKDNKKELNEKIAEVEKVRSEVQQLQEKKKKLETRAEEIKVSQESEEWIAKEGSTLRTLLMKWGSQAGWRVVWNMDRDYTLEAAAIFRGSFVDVSAALLRSFARATPAPKGVFYKGNKVLVISTREDENAD